jgi:hypothetical protein
MALGVFHEPGERTDAMQWLLTLLCLLVLASACESDRGRSMTTVEPSIITSPAPLPSAWLWGMVVDNSGVCIVDATVEVVRGQGLGQSLTQTTPCGAWDYGGGVVFKDLTPGVEMTLRASAPGYEAQEKTVVPSLGFQMAVLFTPSRIQ